MSWQQVIVTCFSLFIMLCACALSMKYRIAIRKLTVKEEREACASIADNIAKRENYNFASSTTNPDDRISLVRMRIAEEIRDKILSR